MIDEIDEIENLPEVSFIDYITLDDVQRQMVSDYQERYETLTGTPTALQSESTSRRASIQLQDRKSHTDTG